MQVGHRCEGNLDRVSRSRLVAVVLATVAVLAFATLGLRDIGAASGSQPGGAPSDRGEGKPGVAAQKRPNVLFILADDLDKSLLPYMPNTIRLIRDQGADFTNFYVEQSSCCPSRASILTGDYAHNHGVIGNTWP